MHRIEWRWLHWCGLRAGVGVRKAVPDVWAARHSGNKGPCRTGPSTGVDSTNVPAHPLTCCMIPTAGARIVFCAWTAVR